MRRVVGRFLKDQEGKAEKGVRRMKQGIVMERLLRPREVAQQLAVSRSTVYRWYWEGRLRGIKLNSGTVRILESSVTRKLLEAD